jgi:hypothetical protein
MLVMLDVDPLLDVLPARVSTIGHSLARASMHLKGCELYLCNVCSRSALYLCVKLRRHSMATGLHVDDLHLVVRDALLSTRATAACPFHPEIIIRVGDDAAETHAFYRARIFISRDGAAWDHDLLVQEIARQLTEAADRVCPECSGSSSA